MRMAEPWRNWSGSVRFSPQRLECPASEADVASIVRAVHRRRGTLRAVGAGHSSSDLVNTTDTLLSLENLRGVIAVDRGRCRATVAPGTPLQALGKALYEHDLALPNYGDVATQTIAGAIGSGTHGTGPDQRNLSSLLVGARIVDGNGEVRVIGDQDDPQLLRAARVSLGALGVFTELTLQLVPAFDVERREYAASTDDAIADWPRLVAGNRSFDLYWYPRRDDVKLRLVNPVGGGTATLPYARLLAKHDGYSHELIPTHSGLPHRFEECEYALPDDAGLACFAMIRERIKREWRKIVGWRVLVRTVAADDSFLSPAHGRRTITISLHQNHSLPWREFFADIEPVFREHGGRPHWGKQHAMRAADLAPRYPAWDAFARVRARFDPDGTFLSPYLRQILGAGHG